MTKLTTELKEQNLKFKSNIWYFNKYNFDYK